MVHRLRLSWPLTMSSSARPGPDRPGPGVSTGYANRMFECHGCKRWQNQGRYRQGVRNEANSSGWDHYCFACVASSPDGGVAASGGYLQPPACGCTRGGAATLALSGGAASPSRPSQSPPPELGGCTSPTDCCAGEDEDIGVGEEGNEKAPEGGAPEEEEVGEVEPEEEEAKEDDPYRWNSAALQVAMSRLGRTVVAYLPTIAADGSFLPSKKTAAGVKGNGKGPAECRTPPREVAAAFRKQFPQAPLCHPVESVETRAIEAMQPNAATLAMKKRENQGADMGEMLRVSAMSVFATINVVVALYVHEVVFFEELVTLKPFQVQTSNGMGVRMICPSCLSNEFVQTPGTSGRGFPALSWQRVRVAHDVDGVVMPVSGKYCCKNPRCPMVIASAQKAAEADAKENGNAVGDINWGDASTVMSHCKSGVSFNTMDERYMKLLPEAIVAKLPFLFFKQNGASEGLMDRVRATEGDTQNFHRIMAAGKQGQEIRNLRRYIRFVRDQQTAERKRRFDGKCTPWPGWKFNRGTLISTPSVVVLNTMYKAGHEEDKDHMQAELETEVSGEFLNWDGTFRIAGRTSDEAMCLFIVMGEDAKIHTFGALRSESQAEITPLLMRYRARRERHHTLHDLKYIYDDRCCQNRGDRRQHFTLGIFPSVTQAPFADAFHLIQNVTSSTTSKDHPRRVQFAKEIGQAVRFKHEPDVEAVTQYLQRRGMEKTEAEAKAKSKSMSTYVRTKSRPKAEMVGAVRKVLEVHTELDAIGKERGELPLLHPPKPKGKSGPAGTASVANNLVSCLEKGCGSDPVPVEEMYMEIGRGPKTQLMSYSKKGGTGKNEAFHSSLNRMVDGTSRIGAVNCEMRLRRRFHRHNFEMQRKHGGTSKQSTEWVWRERDANEAAKGCLTMEPFPKAGPRPEVSKDGFEPMGFEYAKQRRRDELEKCRNEGQRSAGANRVAQRSAVESSQGDPGIDRDSPQAFSRVGGASGVAGVEEQAGGLPQPLQQDRLAVAEASRTDDSAAGGVVGGGASPTINLGGARVKHVRRPTVETQRPLTPRSTEEVALLSQSLAKAQRQREKDVPAAAVELYNIEYYREQFSAESRQTIRAPTSTEKVKKRSIEAAAQSASKNAEKLATAYGKGHSSASNPAASERAASELSTASKPRGQPKKKRIRRDVHAARVTVASGTALAIGEIKNISDTLANMYLRSLQLPAKGNRDAKRQRLLDFFTARNMRSYSPPVNPGWSEVAKATAGAGTWTAVVAGGGAGTEAGAGAGTGAGVDAGAGAGAETGAGVGTRAKARAGAGAEAGKGAWAGAGEGAVVGGVGSIQLAQAHGVDDTSASRGESSLEGFRSI